MVLTRDGNSSLVGIYTKVEQRPTNNECPPRLISLRACAGLVMSLMPGFLIHYVVFAPRASPHERNKAVIAAMSVRPFRIEMLSNQVHHLLTDSSARRLQSMHDMVLVDRTVIFSFLQFPSRLSVRNAGLSSRSFGRLIEPPMVCRTSS